MKTVKVSSLTGAALDWAVAKSEGYTGTALESRTGEWYTPSNDWSRGGPIIERERISTQTTENHWDADLTTESGVFIQSVGPTPLIAAMRCYVASKMDDTIEIPDELTQ